MPPVGFLGFPFFALEVWSLYHLVAPRTTRHALIASVAVVVLALLGIDRWTMSSTAPELRDLPGVTNAVVARLEAAGWDDVFRVARSPAAELAYRANLTPADARAAHEAARRAHRRGSATVHAAPPARGGTGARPGRAAGAPARARYATRGR